MAMGFPSVSCESLIRNSIKDVKRFFSHYHKNNVKIFNLCIEENRIYDKEIFQGLRVGLFPSADHSSCPVKLIFEFCVDLSMFLLQDEENVGAVHCKAGKGRTGVMICCYLIFSGICKDTNKAIEEYAERRSYIKKGVTIPSQKRYIHHFETFLQSNFTKPYYKLIPKIVNNFLTPSNNLLINMLKDKIYHEFINVFNLKKIKIGPFSNRLSLNFLLKNFKNQKKFDSSDKFEKINFKYFIKEEINPNTGKSMSYSILVR
jgi:protein-tyrosine phosphatase